MASISVPCPKCPSATSSPAASSGRSLSTRAAAGSGSFRFFAREPDNRQFPVLRAQVQEVSVPVNSKPETMPKNNVPSEEPEKTVEEAPVSESEMSAFLAEAARLVMLVDSKDVSELKLKHNGCELIIRKKEALEQPAPVYPPITMQYPPTMLPTQPPMPQAAYPAPAAPALSAATTPALKALPPPSAGGSKSSIPPMKSPMAGTLYRSPAPGAPSFVNVGDKVQKGQIVCIIEAMKLMNEIEADKSGTIVEILAENGKPVTFGTPLLVIKP